MEKKGAKFDYKSVLSMLQKLNKDASGVDIKTYHDLCLAFVLFSSSMGSLIAWGFEGNLGEELFRYYCQVQNTHDARSS